MVPENNWRKLARSWPRRAALALFVAGVLSANAAPAAPASPWPALADLVFKPVAQNADLPHAVIPLTMTEGATGFLWLGGDGGLLRWDGYEFREYPAQPALPDGLADNEIWTLHRDARRQLWAGTRSSGLARYDPAQERMVCVPLGEPRCGTQHVWSIADDGSGGLWVATGSGLFRLDAAGKLVGQWHHDDANPASLPDDQVFAVLRDRQGVLWVGSRSGLARSTDNGGGFTPVALNGGTPVAVTHLMQDGAGRLWVGTRQDGAFVIGAHGGPARIIPATAPSADTETSAEVTAVLEIAPNRIWLATDGAGIVEVEVEGDVTRTRRIMHDPFNPTGLDSDAVESLFLDQSGLVWVGTDAGLSQYNPSRFITTVFGHQGRPGGLPGAGVMGVLVTADGSLWAGLQGDGFVLLDQAGHRTTGLAGRRMFAMTPAPAGGVLLGTDGGLFLADPTGREVTRLAIPEFSLKVEVRALRSFGGTVWLAKRDGGLWQLRIDASGKVTVLRHEATPRLTNDVVGAIAVAPDGRLAVGTYDGLNLLDPVSGAIEHILPNPADPHGLDAGFVGAFATDRRGRLWVGTTNGLDILEGRDPTGRPRFRRLGVADGLPNASVDGLIVDRRGMVWASTDMGLAMIDPDNFAVHAVQRADGLAITNYWTDAVAEAPDGDLIFGGIGGLTVVRPEAALQWHYRPPVVITGARVGGRMVPVSQEPGALLVLPPAAGGLAVEFAALDYSAPSRNRYRYRLDGFDTDWVDTDAAHRVASYTNLPPGDYRLRLLGSNRDGLFTEPETTLRIWVLPAWYQTFWFKTAAAVAAVATLGLLLQGWTHILRRRQRELERQVADRTGELSVSKLELEHANAVLELRVAERTQALLERTAALEASEARFRAWFNNAEDAVFVVRLDPGGRFVYEAVNPAVERLFGIAAAAYPGREPAAVLPAEYAAGVLARYREAARNGPIQFESRFDTSGGDRVFESWIVPLRHPATGRVERLVGAARDVTERRALESRLAQAQKLQALGGLAGGIAHDFNNILQAVSGAAVLMEQLPEDQDKIQRLARSTIAAAERGTSITKRLLAFARSDELRVETMPTAEVLEGLSDVLTHTLGSMITVRTAFAAGLPPLLADRGQLETALVNLGTNARDAMPAGGTLTLSAEPELVVAQPPHPAGLQAGAYVRIDVADTGSGMNAATLARVVEPFFTTKPPGRGTGLGLALVKGFAEQSGGGMVIDSTEGVGTTVSLWLRQAGATAVTRPPEPVRHSAPRPAAPRVLVVDDDDLVRETMAEQLERAGFSVVAAAGGAQALAAIRSAAAPPHVMVCDLSMPGMNGIDTIRQARDLVPGLPCFLLTGYAGERAALETGNAFTLLRKPITARALVAQIDATLAAVVSAG